MEEKPIMLFCYGALLKNDVQEKVLGKTLSGQEDVLDDFTVETIPVEGQSHLRAKATPGQTVSGKVFEISMADLYKTDAYEGGEYLRLEKTLRSGTKAWVYFRVRNDAQ